MTANSTFYVTGGTLPGDAVSYVERQADELLFSSLCQHEYCYILTSRQMGKSSLMVRTAARLKENGIRTAVVDLTSLGQNLTVEQWYKGILNRIGQGLGIEEQLDDFWYTHASFPPLERWLSAFQKVILTSVSGEIVIFIDEIDMVRSLPFKTDEFFAGIRACYNRREQTPDFARLTFCLLGVASPSDLIEDSHITPFNIGRRIELFDFTEEEAAILAIGISVTGKDAPILMKRILYWTGGQPYLTQRLCAVVAAEETVMAADDVDRVCRQLFFSRDAQQNDPILAFVRNRILKSGQDVTSLLDLYRRVLTGRRRVEYDPVDPRCEALRLSGIVHTRQGRLAVRNRIYLQVFDRNWIASMIPDELLRQRRAYRTGLLRASTVSAAIAVLLGVLGWRAVFPTYHFASTRSFTVSDLGIVDHPLRCMWLNNVGQTALDYNDGSRSRILDINTKKWTFLTDDIYGATISDSGIVAGLDNTIINGGDHPIVWFRGFPKQGPITEIIPQEANHGFVFMNSKGHILFDNAPPDTSVPPFVAQWCIYDPALKKITVTPPTDLDATYPIFNGNDEIFLSDAAGIVKFANSVRTPVANLTGDLRGVTDGDDILTEDVGTKTCYLQGGPLGSQTIPNFDCKAFKLVAQLKFINNNGYIIGQYNGVPLLWSASSRTRYNLSVIDGWKVEAVGAINDKNQMLALGSQSNGSVHYLLITP